MSKYNNQKIGFTAYKGGSGYDDDDESEHEEKKKVEVKDDPRVRAFLRSYTYVANQQAPDVVLFTQSMLRKMFCAYQSPTGFDPLVRILNQLEDNGFIMEANYCQDDLVIPARKINLLSLPENDR